MGYTGPTKHTRMSDALHRRVGHLTLGARARDVIRMRARQEQTAKAWHWPGLACAAACLLIAPCGVLWLRTPLPPHDVGYNTCVAVTYTDDSLTHWSKRTVIAWKKNGMDSYLKVVAHRPRATKEGGSTP